MEPFRILVTGTRENDRAIRGIVFATLDAFSVSPDLPPHRPVVVIHGQCPNGGVDLYAAQWGQHWGFAVQPYPADWERHGKRAGPIRNTELVASRPDICFGFPGPGSRGTWDCLQKAVNAQIPTRVYPVGPWLLTERR